MRSRYAASRRASSPLTRGKLALDGLHPRPVRLIPAHAGKTPAHPIDHRRCRAHPRSRGENARALNVPETSVGSSPLTRGKLEGVHADLPDVGLIPAHAGKTVASARSPSVPSAHPRSHGENMGVVAKGASVAGSSPLTRGKRGAVWLAPNPDRLIPAHAGKTRGALSRFLAQRAHPRSRGENLPQRRNARLDAGSSPLTRGKPFPHVGERSGGRLIPAHAGKTKKRCVPGRSLAAHPRSRGENAARGWEVIDGSGSSPLTRGKRGGANAAHRGARLIPAHAGKTCFWSCPRATSRAHPRSRGENWRVFRVALFVGGSSPLTRGKRDLDLVCHDGVRLIPAHAGKTSWPSSAPPELPAHPRSRGENNTTLTLSTWNDGSSPLTRGKLKRRPWSVGGLRLIPAHAGKTSRRRCRPSRTSAHPRSRGENTQPRMSSS